MVTCIHCSKENLDEAKFCMSCGSKITENTTIEKPLYTQQKSNSSSNPLCLWCRKSVGFQEEIGKLNSKYGISSHKVRLFICNNCGFSHFFSLGKSIWDFN